MTQRNATREEKIEKLALTIKTHPWYENEPMENLRKMAEYQISQWEKETEKREITSATYENAQRRMTKKVENFLGM